MRGCEGAREGGIECERAMQVVDRGIRDVRVCVRATHSVYAGSHGQEEAAASAEFVEEKQVLVGTCATTQGVNVGARDAHCVAGITNARSSHTRIKHSIHQPGPKLGKMFSVISDSLCNHGQQTGGSADNDWVHAHTRCGAVTDVAVVEGLHSLAVFFPFLQRMNVGTSSHSLLRYRPSNLRLCSAEHAPAHRPSVAFCRGTKHRRRVAGRRCRPCRRSTQRCAGRGRA